MHHNENPTEKQLNAASLRTMSSPWPLHIRCAQDRSTRGRFECEVRKSDALKLRPGQRIRFGDSMWSRKCEDWREGKVLFVTAQGGIRVQTAFGKQWVPYHHVLRKMRDYHNCR
jgi:hypothetical protein